MTTNSLDTLANRFRHFADVECVSSPLYQRLCYCIAEDSDLLALAAQCPPAQPPANLFLAAVRYLLIDGAVTPLHAFYPDLCPAPRDIADVCPHFRTFCLEHTEELIRLLSTRLVQTNEVRRCSYLIPALSHISATSGLPLAIVEVGASAGLNLLWDRYACRYERETGTPGYEREADAPVYERETQTLYAGDPTSPVQLTCALRGGHVPPLPQQMPRVPFRVGIDLNPLNLQDEADALWLRALIWPEHAERFRLLAAASALLRQSPPRLLRGSAADLLPDILREAPADTALVVFHTHVMNQLPDTMRQQLADIIAADSAGRPIYRLANDLGHRAGSHFPLTLTTCRNGRDTETHLANVDGHGAWLEWLAN